MIEEPKKGRASINYDGYSLFINIPSKKNWFIVAFFTIWIIGWYQGETSALKELLAVDSISLNSFLLVWVTLWTIGGLFAVGVLLWTLFGFEKILIDKRNFTLSKGILNISLSSKTYDINSIKNLELNPESSNSNSLFMQKRNMGEFYGFKGGKLRFDYGMKTIKFGIGIDKAEALHLLNLITKHGFYKATEN